ncbi:MAG: hypothetical protein Q4P18_05965 [Methanobrevibacter sp.]|uniref:hypothetical protein n=1 Tax=Methanobrevibacter sp. TaxID=66852 RepID=UPI0026DF0604|nr:hypothetical protein [Methanobrevibacter sp.]MDO5849059.1 hypothetical protein [Methanobrevibacter sp.]
MELLWFYIALVLAISDTIHTQIVWKLFKNFYIVLGGIIHSSVDSNVGTWLIHELIEALFHFLVLSAVFLSLEIGILAALIHLIIDISHTIFFRHSKLNEVEHRALHFVIESIFFMAIYGI